MYSIDTILIPASKHRFLGQVFVIKTKRIFQPWKTTWKLLRNHQPFLIITNFPFIFYGLIFYSFFPSQMMLFLWLSLLCCYHATTKNENFFFFFYVSVYRLKKSAVRMRTQRSHNKFYYSFAEFVVSALGRKIYTEYFMAKSTFWYTTLSSVGQEKKMLQEQLKMTAAIDA